MDVLNKFLQAEINSKEYYESIINFINLYEIRKVNLKEMSMLL